MDGRVPLTDAAAMVGVAPLPVNGTVILDTRDAGRTLRVSWHPELEVFVVSLWRDDHCVGTIHMAPDDAAQIVHALVDVMARDRSTGSRQLA